MKKCQDMEAYVEQDVILANSEKKVEHGEHNSYDDVKNGS